MAGEEVLMNIIIFGMPFSGVASRTSSAARKFKPWVKWFSGCNYLFSLRGPVEKNKGYDDSTSQN